MLIVRVIIKDHNINGLMSSHKNELIPVYQDSDACLVSGNFE